MQTDFKESAMEANIQHKAGKVPEICGSRVRDRIQRRYWRKVGNCLRKLSPASPYIAILVKTFESVGEYNLKLIDVTTVIENYRIPLPRRSSFRSSSTFSRLLATIPA
jgi:hypothetical protein